MELLIFKSQILNFIENNSLFLTGLLGGVILLLTVKLSSFLSDKRKERKEEIRKSLRDLPNGKVLSNQADILSAWYELNPNERSEIFLLCADGYDLSVRRENGEIEVWAVKSSKDTEIEDEKFLFSV